MRYVFLGNFTGHPGITFPCGMLGFRHVVLLLPGYDEQGLPIGLQVYGKMHDEDLVLKVASVGEHVLEKKKPKVFFDIL
jgi:Asp-tRNA(Asn)/Glu-tRNA(Gln) amidotransferase A subunit family amidase